MKKKILLIGIAVILLVISYFAGDHPSTEPESVPETVQTERVTLSEEVSSQDGGTEEKTEVETGTSQEETVESEPPESTGQTESSEEEKTTCTLSVRCDAVLQNMDDLAEGKESIIPQDGTLYPEQRVEFSEGESVFDVLYREMRNRNIPFEFVKTPMYNSVYIEGIGNLYEFDCGDYSGWTYRVNGVKPTVGCSQYAVQSGDIIVVSYTCNFMKDR